MATSRIKTSSVLQGFPKSRSLLAGNAAYIPDNFESIATVIVGSGGSSTITFSSIPSTYAHLQIRGIARDARVANEDSMSIKYNNDSGNNYFGYHEIYGDGATASAFAGNASTTQMLLDRIAGNSATASAFGAVIIDILDYADTNKYKTQRFLGGVDRNGAGAIAFGSGLWMSTSAINQITLAGANGNFSQYSKFALYGIRD